MAAVVPRVRRARVRRRPRRRRRRPVRSPRRGSRRFRGRGAEKGVVPRLRATIVRSVGAAPHAPVAREEALKVRIVVAGEIYGSNASS